MGDSAAAPAPSGGKLEKRYFDVLGICCPSEVPLVEKLLQPLAGMQTVSVVVPSRTVIVVHDASTISQAQIGHHLPVCSSRWHWPKLRQGHYRRRHRLHAAGAGMVCVRRSRAANNDDTDERSPGRSTLFASRYFDRRRSAVAQRAGQAHTQVS